MENEETDEDGISEEIVSEAAQKKLGHENFKILKYTLESLPKGIGLLGDHSLLIVTIIDDNEAKEKDITFFVKFFPKYEASAKFCEGIGAFKKEVFVYKLLSDFLEKNITMVTACTPKCYLSKPNKFLLLDNLIEENFERLDKHETLEYDVILVVLNSLAQLHASSLIYEEKRSFELGKEYRLIDEYEEDFEESFFNDREGFMNAQGIEASIKCVVNETEIFQFPKTLPSGKNFADVTRQMCNKIFDLVRPSKTFRNVLCHGDLWATNFLVKYNPNKKITQCKFIDFQCGRYVPPSQDVLSVLYLTTSKDFRNKYLYQVIGTYYSYLEKHLKSAGYSLEKIIPFHDFLNSCEEQKLFAMVETAIYFPLILIRNDSIDEYFSDKELNQKALFEDRSYLVLAHMEKDESYSKRLRESIEDLKEYCNYR